MQELLDPLGQLLRQLAGLGNATALQGREASACFGQTGQNPSAIMLIVAMGFAPPPSTCAPPAANDNREG